MRFFKIFILLLVVVLIVLRLCLPYFLLHYVVKQINTIPEYRAKIDDLDVHLYRSSYTLIHVQLWKINKKIPIPYFEAKTIDFSLQWGALLHGKIVAKIIVQKPMLNFVSDPNNQNDQLSIDDQWIAVVKKLFPLNINRVDLHEGQVYFISFKGNPPFKTYVKNIEFSLQNMQNADRNSQLLPSAFTFTGNPMDGGEVKITGRFNPFKQQPTFSLRGSLIGLQVSQIANFLKHYTGIDVVKGTFNLYVELVAANGKINGYAKPFLKNLKIGDPKKESPLGVIYNGIVAVAAKILENPQKKNIATKINISGKIDNPNTSILSIIGYSLRHAFIQALLPQIDHNIKMQDVLYPNQPSVKNFPHYKE